MLECINLKIELRWPSIDHDSNASETAKQNHAGYLIVFFVELDNDDLRPLK